MSPERGVPSDCPALELLGLGAHEAEATIHANTTASGGTPLAGLVGLEVASPHSVDIVSVAKAARTCQFALKAGHVCLVAATIQAQFDKNIADAHHNDELNG